MTIAIHAQPLTKEIVKAIRTAKDIGFRLNNLETQMCFRSKKKDAEFLHHPCNTRIYMPSKNPADMAKTLKGWVCEDLNSCYPHFDTFARLLKEGDIIRCEWYEANNNGYLSESNYHGKMPTYTHLFRDELHVIIDRGTPRKNLSFLMAVGVCADNPEHPNNTARICRREWV